MNFLSKMQYLFSLTLNLDPCTTHEQNTTTCDCKLDLGWVAFRGKCMCAGGYIYLNGSLSYCSPFCDVATDIDGSFTGVCENGNYRCVDD